MFQFNLPPVHHAPPWMKMTRTHTHWWFSIIITTTYNTKKHYLYYYMLRIGSRGKNFRATSHEKHKCFFFFCFFFFLSSSESLVSSFKIVSSSFVSFCHWIYPKMGREKGTNNIPLLALDSPPRRTRNYATFSKKIFNKSNGEKKNQIELERKTKSSVGADDETLTHTHTHTHELKKNFPFVFYSILFYSLFVNCLWVQLCSSFVIEKQQPISLCACLSFGVCACVCVCINKF